MATAYQEYPTEEGMYPTEDSPAPVPAKPKANADKEARLAAARARADAAKAAVERRRQSEVEKPASEPGMYPTEDAGMYPTEDTPAPAQARAVPMKTRAAPAPVVPATPDTSGEDLAAEMERIQRESDALSASEGTVEQRLQWYSEVVGLRKELAVVKEDEATLRKQLAEAESAAAAHDPEVDKELAMLEDEAQQSPLQHAWAEACQNCNPDEQEPGAADISNLNERVRAARNKVNESQERAAALAAEQEEKINEHTDHRERTKASLKESFDEEMGNLKEARTRLRQVESEKAYHNKRGTTRRQPGTVVPKEKLQESRQRRIDVAEGRSAVEVERMTSELSNLMDECKLLKKQLDDVQAQQNKKRDTLETTLKETTDEGSDVREFKEKLEKEKEELTNLKADLQGVLHYVRAKNREEDEF